jgi:uncharacterized pyridoxal phosphate-containing UPF0001 family protein
LVCLYSTTCSLDGIKLAERINQFAAESEKASVLLECNVSGKRQNCFPAWQEDRWQELIPMLEQVAGCSNLDVRGLMTMAPYFPEAEMARPYFQRLRRLQAYLTRRIPQVSWVELSMGMSGDYEVAVEEGATIVRIGTAILGSRPIQEEIQDDHFSNASNV